MKDFLGKDENIYGLSFHETSTKDTSLISTSHVFDDYPSTNDIYNLIKKLQVYIEDCQSKQTGNPLLNISSSNQHQYKVMVALPTITLLPSKGDIAFKRMVPGKFLTTTVVGGYGVVDKAFHQTQQYLQDYQRVVMAIPFQVLLTDRIQTTDTSKWQTKLYFPIF